MINAKIAGILVAAFVAGSLVASPELRAYAANTVFSTDIVDGQVMTADLANNAVTAVKIKDGEVKAAEIAPNAVGASEIATDAVGAAELQGVTKLIFGKCAPTSTEALLDIPPGEKFVKACSINGVAIGDYAIATLTRAVSTETASECFAVTNTNAHGGAVDVTLVNVCDSTQELGKGSHFAVMVYNK